jgi:hypothetical protein
VSRLEEEKEPNLAAWLNTSERINEVFEVLDFAREMISSNEIERFIALNPPASWVDRLRSNPGLEKTTVP